MLPFQDFPHPQLFCESQYCLHNMTYAVGYPDALIRLRQGGTGHAFSGKFGTLCQIFLKKIKQVPLLVHFACGSIEANFRCGVAIMHRAVAGRPDHTPADSALPGRQSPS